MKFLPNAMLPAGLPLPLTLTLLLIGLTGVAPPAWAQQETTWQMLMQAEFEEVETPEGPRWLPNFPPEVERLDGTSVRVAGYMIPLGYEEEQTHFLVSAYPGDGCFFHLPGGPNAVVEVRAERGVTFTYDRIAVQGDLELLRDDPYGLLYRMADARPVR